MGVGISNWRLAGAVARLGQLGVVSGTALDQVLVRRLQDGDPGGHMRRGLDQFPIPAMAERMAKALELAGASVQSVTSAPAALANIAEQTPTVILCDIGLPGVDGLSFMESLRALRPESGGRVLAAALTAYAAPADRLRALQAGYQMHLPKPLEPADVIAAGATLAGQPADGPNERRVEP